MKLLQQLLLPGLLVSASILSIASANAQENAVYTVQSGDTPCEIAQFFRVPCAQLIDENDLGADPIIYTGQILKVPLLGTAGTNTDNTIAQTQTQAQIQDTSPVEVTAVVVASTDDAATINFADLVTVYQLAKASDPVFAAEGYRRDAAAEILPQSRAALRPQLTAGGALTSATTDSLDTTSASIALSQTLYNRASSVAVKQADQQTAQAALVFAVATESLITRTVNAYFSVLAMQDNVELSQSNQRAIGRQLELAEQRLEVGLGTRTDLFDARARYENAVADTIEAEKLLDDARQTLIALVGEDMGELQPLAKSAQLMPPQPDDAEQWVARALSDNRTLKAKSLGISLSSLEIDRQQAQRLPDVGLQLSGNYSDTVLGDDTSARI
ncbi:MAG: TolC family protein, partial [Pseudomonadota bacterium]